MSANSPFCPVRVSGKEIAMVASSGIASNRFEVEELRTAWKNFGADLSFDLSVNYGLCVVEGCAGMSFVGLRTSEGPRPVCLKHYDEIVDLRSKIPA
jgi:hypothetical protein